MNRPYAPPSRPTPSAVVGAGRTATTHAYPPAPPSRASTSVPGTSASGSDIASDLYYSPHATSTFTPSPSFGDNSSSVSHSHSHSPFNNNWPAAARSPRPGFSSDGASSDYTAGTAVHRSAPAALTAAQRARASPSPAVLTPPRALSSSPSPSPPLPIPLRAVGSVGPVTPARNGAFIASSSQAHEQQWQQQQQQQQQRQLPQPPSSSRSKGSVAETPSGDLANFHLLKGSPLQSVVDFDTPTPSPRTPSASPADHQAFALASRTSGAPYFPLPDGRRFLPGSASISPTYARAQRAAAAIPDVRSYFYCRVCQVDPCREITVTACGHVFCNACIVEEVRENARCPVCNAAVLLFALLKLDLS